VQYPIGWPDRVPGDGFLIGHGFATENTWYNPGWWHTGEDWYALEEEETGGAIVYSMAAGEVVYADYDYPGRVVIVQHEEELFSCYGHLDEALEVAVGDSVLSGDHLGTVVVRDDGRAPSHLHFEVRTFLTTPDVNGSSPRHGVNCGVDCPPGPGYWPIDAEEHPVDMGWLNPSSSIASLTAKATEVIVATGAPDRVETRSEPDGESTGEAELSADQTFALLKVKEGDPMSTESSAEAYNIWYQVELPDGTTPWLPALIPTDHETGSDGRPSSLQLILLPT
jgi:murein DD-endopeptidase MepM/ murein hydrolase activator NlpD